MIFDYSRLESYSSLVFSDPQAGNLPQAPMMPLPQAQPLPERPNQFSEEFMRKLVEKTCKPSGPSKKEMQRRENNRNKVLLGMELLFCLYVQSKSSTAPQELKDLSVSQILVKFQDQNNCKILIADSVTKQKVKELFHRMQNFKIPYNNLNRDMSRRLANVNKEGMRMFTCKWEANLDEEVKNRFSKFIKASLPVSESSTSSSSSSSALVSSGNSPSNTVSNVSSHNSSIILHQVPRALNPTSTLNTLESSSSSNSMPILSASGLSDNGNNVSRNSLVVIPKVNRALNPAFILNGAASRNLLLISGVVIPQAKRALPQASILNRAAPSTGVTNPTEKSPLSRTRSAFSKWPKK